MYGTGAAWPGYGCYVSADLENWTGPFQVFTPPADFDGTTDWWAPECHAYQGKFYLFATYKGASGHRGVSIFRSDSPLGPFEEINRATPADWDAIDGTLYVDEENQPWMVFVHEWTSMPDGVGDFSCVRLSDDLTQTIGEITPLFKASELPRKSSNFVTDGCWLYRSESGRLIMLWSGLCENGYCVAQAVSLSGKVTGPWVQNPVFLYEKNDVHALDGGHGALFYGPENQLMLSIHSPNNPVDGQHATPAFFNVIDKGASLVLEGDSTPWLRSAFAQLWNAAVCVISWTYGVFQPS
jgi:beta-xylosidase